MADLPLEALGGRTPLQAAKKPNMDRLARQGRSGLGLDAQEAAIAAFLRPGDHLLAPPYTEVESGRKDDRPELAKALARCRATGATLIIA